VRILITTSVFHPRLGGIETVARLLAREFTRQGHSVTLLTGEPASEPDKFEFQVVRTCSPLKIFRCALAAQGIIQLGGIRLGWPTLLLRRKSLIVHSNWLPTRNPKRSRGEWLRKRWLGRSGNLCPSRAMQINAPFPCEILANAYDDEIFRNRNNGGRNRDIIFLGRMVADKGPDLLLDALAILARNGLHATATFVGDGRLLGSCRKQAESLGLQTAISFCGALQGLEVAQRLNQHRICVVPSRCPEAFGIVALEAIACGCVVVGSESGGLPEAIGPCGVTFPNGDADRLSAAIEQLLLSTSDRLARYLRPAAPHLQNHNPDLIARRYLQFLNGSSGARAPDANSQR
jgi:glycogen synthase